MITILKKGKTKFTTICKKCGCEFEYELSDLEYGYYVICPECKDKCYHEFQDEKSDESVSIFESPCKNCYVKTMMDKGIYIQGNSCLDCPFLKNHVVHCQNTAASLNFDVNDYSEEFKKK